MKRKVIGLNVVERILIKVVIVQFIFLFLSQLFFHQIDIFPQIKQLTKYEGVNENTFTEILPTLQSGEK
ncbi:YpfB family protein [Neobacillus jeddahensis]|uniref:YpfB family protein n=1 Tax=Neobacillus jeddahensis TaxID=1461580 RepID=UPI00058F3140|nr:YpfB family protein [Neobacillus jeddahensis]